MERFKGEPRLEDCGVEHAEAAQVRRTPELWVFDHPAAILFNAPATE